MLFTIIHHVSAAQTPGATTQLWRMSGEGQLIHIASSENAEQDMVLDVANNLPRPGEYTPLVLSRRTKSSRLASQTWQFAGDHLVLRETQTLCVQTKKGFESFRDGKYSNNSFLLSTQPVLSLVTLVYAPYLMEFTVIATSFTSPIRCRCRVGGVV